MSGTMGATSTPPTPAMTVLSAQFTSAMRCGERPVTKAPFSDSAAARVARPKRESRNQSPSAIESAMMTAADHSRSPGTRLPSIWYDVRREDRRDGDRGRAELRWRAAPAARS